MLERAAEEFCLVTADAGELWSYRLDFANLPAYNPGVSAVEQTAEGSGPGGRLGAGAAYRFDLATPHGPHTVTLEVTNVVEGEEVTATMAGAITAHETFRVEQAGDSSCRATLALWMDIPDEVDAELRTALLEGGADQIRAELDAMARVMGGTA